ncbi:MAG TPA: YHS domain-containing protein [Atribacterota bacterium]|nr:YHS domain-containing protein [Atribacterota bacterium]
MAKKVCVVCGEEIKNEKTCADHEGKHYCFCSEDCRDEFESSPEEYIEENDVDVDWN